MSTKAVATIGIADSCPTTPNKPNNKGKLTQEHYKLYVPVSPEVTVKKIVDEPITSTPKAKQKERNPPKSSTKLGKKTQESAIDSILLFDEKEASNDLAPKSPSKSEIVSVPKEVDLAYKVISKRTRSLGGNGYNGAIYGELTMHSMQKVCHTLVELCELSHNSRFIDVGSGLGKPNFHAAQYPGVRISIGVELELIRWQLAMHNLDCFVSHIASQATVAAPETDSEKVREQVLLNGGVNFIVSDIDKAVTMDPFTHIYMYDLGFPPDLQQSIARKFNSSVHARYLISYRPPRRVIEEYGYNVEHVTQLSTSMFGSGEKHTAYFYKRIGKIPAAPMSETGQVKVHIPRRETFEENDIDVFCDPLFEECVTLATQEEDALVQHVQSIVAEHLSSPRAVRERKPSTRLK